MGAINEQKVQLHFCEANSGEFPKAERRPGGKEVTKDTTMVKPKKHCAVTIAWSQTVQITIPSFISYVLMGRLLICSVLQFCNLKILNNKKIHLMGLLANIF